MFEGQHDAHVWAWIEHLWVTYSREQARAFAAGLTASREGGNAETPSEGS